MKHFSTVVISALLILSGCSRYKDCSRTPRVELVPTVHYCPYSGGVLRYIKNDTDTLTLNSPSAQMKDEDFDVCDNNCLMSDGCPNPYRSRTMVFTLSDAQSVLSCGMQFGYMEPDRSKGTYTHYESYKAFKYQEKILRFGGGYSTDPNNQLATDDTIPVLNVRGRDYTNVTRALWYRYTSVAGGQKVQFYLNKDTIIMINDLVNNIKYELIP